MVLVGDIMKKASFFCFLIVFFVTCISFGDDLNESQKKILKFYPSWTKEQKNVYFTETANYYSESCPQTIDKVTTLMSVKPLLEKPGLKYIVKFSLEQVVWSEKEWNDLFRDININLHNSLCSDPSMHFFIKLKDTVFVYDYFDKRGVFLKRISIPLNEDCAKQ